MEKVMLKRQTAIDEAYEAVYDGGKGSHHPDYQPDASGPGGGQATRETGGLRNAIIKARRAARRARRTRGALARAARRDS